MTSKCLEALRQTAREFMALYDETEKTFDNVLDVDAEQSWKRLAEGTETENDLEIIVLRAPFNAR